MDTIREIGKWIGSASEMTLLLVFLVLSSGTIAAITFFLIRKYLPKRWIGAKDENDAPMLTRDWFGKIEQRAKDLHDVRALLHDQQLRDVPRWDAAAEQADDHAPRIAALEADLARVKPRLEEVAKKTHDFSGRAGEITQISERLDSLEARHEGHMTEAARQTTELSGVKVEVARLGEKVTSVKESTDRIERTVERLGDRILGPVTPPPRRVSE